VIESEAGYLVPRSAGRVLAGSTMERVGFRKGVTASGIAGLARAAAAMIPALRDAGVVATWSGLRPATADGLPAIGAATVPGLYYAAGHLRNGIVLAPATARQVVRLLLGKGPEVDLEPFSPRRFAAGPAVSGGRRRTGPWRGR
jgi:glycine oxidase